MNVSAKCGDLVLTENIAFDDFGGREQSIRCRTRAWSQDNPVIIFVLADMLWGRLFRP